MNHEIIDRFCNFSPGIKIFHHKIHLDNCLSSILEFTVSKSESLNVGISNYWINILKYSSVSTKNKIHDVDINFVV